MRVIGRKKRMIIVRCHDCKNSLEIRKKDLSAVNTVVVYAGETWDPQIAIECCECGAQNIITEQVPHGIRSKLYSRG